MRRRNKSIRGNGLHIALWVSQCVLALMFLMAGWLKATLLPSDIAIKMPSIRELPLILIRFIGIAELAAAVGLVLPALLRIKPNLTAWAAAGISVITGLAIAYHAQRGEEIAIVSFLFTLAVFVAWGRFTRAKIQPRS